MNRSKNFRKAAISIATCFLLTVLPTATAFAQPKDSGEALFEASRHVQFETKSGEPEALLYLGDDRLSPELWSLERRPVGKAVTAAGSFRPAKRFSLAGATSDETMAVLETKGVRQYDRELVVGTIYAPDGSERLVAAVRFDFVLEDGAVQASGMVPILTGTSLEALQVVAEQVAEVMVTRSMPSSFGPGELDTVPGKSICRNYCSQDLESDTLHCNLVSAACITAAGAAATLCVIACPVTGPLVLACLAACVIGDAAAISLCILNNNKCKRDARRAWRDCLSDCPQDPPPF